MHNRGYTRHAETQRRLKNKRDHAQQAIHWKHGGGAEYSERKGRYVMFKPYHSLMEYKKFNNRKLRHTEELPKKGVLHKYANM
jgi:hypothetical protein